jgi:hypothetical protein
LIAFGLTTEILTAIVNIFLLLSILSMGWVKPRGSQRNVVYLALVYEPKCGGRGVVTGGVSGSQLMRTALHMEPKNLWRSNSIFNPSYKL